MQYFVMAPAVVRSGGPQLCHQMCYALSEYGRNARMYYYLISGETGVMPIDIDCVDRYKKYATSHVIDFSEIEQKDSVVVFPESFTRAIPQIRNAKKVLWWMSVDNYRNNTLEEDMPLIKEEVDLHLVQSYYAYHYLTDRWRIPASKILYVSDYIDEVYGSFVFPPAYRKDIALYNPKKGFEELEPLIKMTPRLQWRPLKDLTTEQMIVLMQSAKLYVDFGNHPGKDRIPREAASCGCCVLTNKRGSAAFYQDVPIPECYKFENVSEEYEKIAAFLQEICENFEEHFIQFEDYRKFIASEKDKFFEDVGNFIERCECGQ